MIEEVSIQGVAHYRLQIDGDNLRDVLATPGVKVGDRRTGEKAKTRSNSIHAVANTLGIEAARYGRFVLLGVKFEQHSTLTNPALLYWLQSDDPE